MFGAEAVICYDDNMTITDDPYFEVTCRNQADEEVVRLALKNKEYFLCLMHRYEDKLLRYIIRISGVSREEAEDTLQESYLKVYTNLRGFDPRMKFSSWLYRIVHNQTISGFRRRQQRPQVVANDDDQVWLERLPAEVDIPRDVDRKIARQRIDRALRKIPKLYREPLVLHFLEGKNYREMSDILRKPPGTVATLVFRGKQKLAQRLQKSPLD